MAAGTLTEPRKVSKKKSQGKPTEPQTPEQQQPTSEPEPAFGRIELQAAPSWIAELDRMAEAMGVSRSAYIRMACNLKMAADKRSLGMNGKDKE